MSPLAIFLYFLAAAVMFGVMVGYNYFLRIYFRAQMANAPVPLGRIVRLTLRGLDARAIVEAYTSAVKAEVEADLEKLVNHAQAGGNPRRVVATLIETKANEGSVTLEQACEYDLSEHGVIEFPADDTKPGRRVGQNGS